MMKWTIVFILWALALTNGENSTRMSELIPQEMHGWRAAGKDETYDRNTIFRYMDGGGELYRSYAFRELLVRRFVKTDEPDIVVEIYDMGSSKDAFGIFSYEREDEPIGIGQDSEYGPGFIRFWKDRFFVYIFSEGETPSAKQTLLDLGKAVAEAIPSAGVRPRMLAYLPTEGLIEKSVRYFHNQPCLNYHYFLANKNILNLGEHTEVVLARYQQDEHKSYLLLVCYPDARQAKTAYESFMNAYMPEAKSTGVLQTEDGKWTAARLHQEFVIIVLDAPTRAQAEALIEAVRNKKGLTAK